MESLFRQGLHKIVKVVTRLTEIVTTYGSQGQPMEVIQNLVRLTSEFSFPFRRPSRIQVSSCLEYGSMVFQTRLEL